MKWLLRVLGEPSAYSRQLLEQKEGHEGKSGLILWTSVWPDCEDSQVCNALISHASVVASLEFLLMK